MDTRNNCEKLFNDSNSLYEKLKFVIYICHQNRFQGYITTNNYFKHLINTFVFLNKNLIFFP